MFGSWMPFFLYYVVAPFVQRSSFPVLSSFDAKCSSLPREVHEFSSIKGRNVS